MLVEIREAVAEHLKGFLDVPVYPYVKSNPVSDWCVVRLADTEWTTYADVVNIEIDVNVNVREAADRVLTKLAANAYAGIQTFDSNSMFWAGDPYQTTISDPTSVSGTENDVAQVSIAATVIRAREAPASEEGSWRRRIEDTLKAAGHGIVPFGFRPPYVQVMWDGSSPYINEYESATVYVAEQIGSDRVQMQARAAWRVIRQAVGMNPQDITFDDRGSPPGGLLAADMASFAVVSG